MIPLQGQDPFYVKMLAEHRELHSLLEAVESRLDAARGEASEEDPDWTALPELLKGLLACIEHHFTEEEEGGVLEEAMSRLPRLCPQVAALERQHKPLLTQLGQLVERSQGCGSSAKQWQSVARDFCRFAYALRAHEAAEDRIAEEAFYGEVGV
jgi:hypothetical protein